MKSRPGFTLVDLIIALAILAVIMTAVYAVFVAQQRATAAASESRDVHGQALLLMDRLTRDISGAWLPAQNTVNDRIQYLFSGDESTLNFISTAVLSADETGGADLVELGYRVEERSGERTQRLLRRQDDTPDDEPEDGGTEFILTRNLVSLEFRFLDGDGVEHDTWPPSDTARLPASVRIEMILSTKEDQEQTFIAEVAVPLAQKAVRGVKLPDGLELPF